MNLIIILLWIIATFVISCSVAIIGKKFGVEYPIALVASLVVMANIFANKIVEFGPFNVPAGVIVFSMIFFITDIISEKWGKKDAKKAIYAGFISNIILVISILIVINWQSPEFASEFSKKFSDVLSLTPRITIAGFIAYIISQKHDIWAYHLIKKKTKGKLLWLRNNLSTISSQLIDSIIFITIAFFGVMPIIPLILGQWVVKIIIALIDTPFLYLTSWIMDKIR